jgi:hypothetical protein
VWFVPTRKENQRKEKKRSLVVVVVVVVVVVFMHNLDQRLHLCEEFSSRGQRFRRSSQFPH